MIYNIAVSRRVIRRIDGDEDVIQNGVVSDAIRVTFDEEWLALLGARAVFRNSSSGKVVTVEFEPAADTQIAIPWEVLANEGYLFVSFVGAPAEDSRIVTREMERPWTVAPSGCIAGLEPGGPTVDVTTQLIAKAREALKEALAALGKSEAAANSAAQGSIGSSDVVELREQNAKLAQLLADSTEQFIYMSGTVYCPASKASVSGTTVKFGSTCSASGNTITLA